MLLSCVWPKAVCDVCGRVHVFVYQIELVKRGEREFYLIKDVLNDQVILDEFDNEALFHVTQKKEASVMCCQFNQEITHE